MKLKLAVIRHSMLAQICDVCADMGDRFRQRISPETLRVEGAGEQKTVRRFRVTLALIACSGLISNPVIKDDAVALA